MKFTKKENGIIANTNAKKGLILKLLNDQAGYIKRKISEKNIIMVGSGKISQNGLIN